VRYLGEKPKHAKNIDRPWAKRKRTPSIPNLYITSGEIDSPSPFAILKELIK
jgi:hypothetical protein